MESISIKEGTVKELLAQMLTKEKETLEFKAKISYISNKGLLTLGFNQPIEATAFNLTKLSSADLQFTLEPSYEATDQDIKLL